MPEKQDIEWKESWRDEYLKWVCAFANVEGGVLYVGKDNKGVVKGISDATRLMEDLPNKVKSLLGMLVEINLHQENGKDYLEIVVDKYPYPVSYKGRYFIRTGSTTQELTGNDLNKFLLEKVGKTWDAVPVPDVGTLQLSGNAFDRYKQKAMKTNRIDQEVLDDGNDMLLENLRFKDQHYLKRAALLLFHPDPEKFITGAFIKIGYFKSDDDLVFQDEIHGHLMDQLDKVVDLLKTKYSTYLIGYEGISRIEKSSFPEDALREAILNAVAHRDYSEPVPIQISVYPDKIMIWNAGRLSEKLSVQLLSQKHPSIPNNPDLANGLFRCGDIESWGRGTIRMIRSCLSHQILPPQFKSDQTGFTVTFIAEIEETLNEQGFGDNHVKILKQGLAGARITNKMVQDICNVSKATASRYLEDLEGVYLERVGETGRGTYYKTMGS